jgi:YebC/PmpR family DNA-binding regulatory protein
MGAQWKTKLKSENSSAKGKIFTKLSKEIMVAARGGADPNMNSRLRLAVDNAKKHSMPKDTLERAIKKGAGLLDDQTQFETVVYEGFAPHRVPVIVECLTDNKNRTATNIRILFRKGQLSPVAWDFAHLGMIEASPQAGAADAETAAIEAGAQDVEPVDDTTSRFYTEPADLDLVQKALGDQKWTVSTAALGWRAKNPVKVTDEAARAEVVSFLEAIDEDDDVQHIYAGFEG